MTEETKAKIRRYNSNIEMSGRGIIAFGLWTAIKIWINLMVNVDTIKQGMDSHDEPIDFYLQVVFVTAGVLCISIIIVNVYVGISAIMYGRGNRKKKTFVIWAVILALLSLIFIVLDIINQEDMFDERIAELLADTTTLFILFDMVYSMIMARLTIKREQV